MNDELVNASTASLELKLISKRTLILLDMREYIVLARTKNLLIGKRKNANFESICVQSKIETVMRWHSAH